MPQKFYDFLLLNVKIDLSNNLNTETILNKYYMKHCKIMLIQNEYHVHLITYIVKVKFKCYIPNVSIIVIKKEYFIIIIFQTFYFRIYYF